MTSEKLLWPLINLLTVIWWFPSNLKPRLLQRESLFTTIELINTLIIEDKKNEWINTAYLVKLPEESFVSLSSKIAARLKYNSFGGMWLKCRYLAIMHGNVRLKTKNSIYAKPHHTNCGYINYSIKGWTLIFLADIVRNWFFTQWLYISHTAC